MEPVLLNQPRLSIITRQPDAELARIHDVIKHKVLVDGRTDLEAALSQLLALPESHAPQPKTLDLIGHSTTSSLLQLGDWVIDAASATVTAFFRELADLDVLARLNIHAVRLLGCKTADTLQARATLSTLQDILGVEVYGTTGLVGSVHYDAEGFQDAWRFLLIGSSDVRVLDSEPCLQARGAKEPRSLDIDALCAGPISSAGWPVRIASAQTARNVLRLVRRDEGALVPGLLAIPSCEIAIPSMGGHFHLVQILLDAQFIRVYFDGSNDLGVLYPVSNPQALSEIVEELPLA